MEKSSYSYGKITAIINEIEKVIVGKRSVVEMLVVALLSGGHVLIEDVPGVGKTTLAMALGKATGLLTKRAQFTPDVMASDITGFSMFNKQTNQFEYCQGLVMTNILLADEINRTSPKTQSALLEAMEEHQVTVDGVNHKLPEPFMVIATQNNHGYVGTFPLPEAQLDRFLMKISMGYPSVDEEVDILAGRQQGNPLKYIIPIFTKEELVDAMDSVKQVHIDRNISRYIVSLVAQTRSHPSVALGGSPRASLSLMRTAQAYAYVRGRNFVAPEDIISVLSCVLSHRIILTQEAKIKRVSVNSVLRDAVKAVNPPFKGTGNA